MGSLAMLAAASLLLAPPARPAPAADSTPPAETTEYDGDSGIAMGEVLDYDANPQCAGVVVNRRPDGSAAGTRPCVPHRLLKLRVSHSFHGSRLGVVLFHLYGGGSRGTPEPLRRGDVLLVTFDRRDEVDSWSCGRLRPCSEKPDYQFMARELFRRLTIPPDQDSIAAP